MGTIDLKELFYGLQKQMIAELKTNRECIPHPGTKGDCSEINWIEWLKKYLPKRYSVDKAFIIDCNNSISEQIDIVIYDQQYSPFVFNQGAAKYIPAESVYAIFEVKQELSKFNVQYAAEKAESVRNLTRTSAPIMHAGGSFPPKEPKEILAGLLTLTSTWVDPLGESFDNCLKSLSKKQRLNIGCILECGSFLINYTEGMLDIKKSTNEEAFISFFLNLLMELQKVGTITAMDIMRYAQVLDSI
ncbi:DUF6602 domain-containing protein [Candidatus Clostridium radicumherbarum]|uniref:DUF6602 domain-containing protein n=1 Tax=Candidatus Clostridium radicumherbarum TaxID=3381662 RepID=A0ABW8TSF0_9CLOT